MHSQCCYTYDYSLILECLYHPRKKPPIQPLAASNLVSVFKDLPILDILYE